MFNLFKSKEEKQQEQVAAYIDQQMSQAERNRFEADLKQNEALQAEVDAQQEIKSLLSRAPKLKAPRNFVLDPALYGGKAPAPSFIELLYPKMRVATAAVSFMFVILLGVGIFQSGSDLNTSQQALDDVALLPAADIDSDGGASSAESDPAIALTVPAQAIPTELPAPIIQQDEAVEVMKEVEEAEFAEDEMMADVAADEAPINNEIVVAESADAEAPAAMSEADVEAGAAPEKTEPISPRAVEPADDFEGERVGEAEEVLPAPVETVAPQLIEPNLNFQVSAEENDQVESSDIAGLNDYASTNQQSSQSPIVIAVWVLGALVVMLAAATFIIRRKLD